MKMTIIQRTSLLSDLITEKRKEGVTIGFVPTMGALHAGHLQLIGASGAQCNLTVCSIFVNPTQFNDQNDFLKYPNTREKDIRQLYQSAAGVLFLPSVADIYPVGTGALETYDLGYLDRVLEAAFRPGHFQGVCQVMSRLLGMVQPDRLYMGQKDYQQCMVVRRLLGLLQLPVTLEIQPTLREPDGLAMSSRNTRLQKDQRDKAPLIYRTMLYIQSGLSAGSLRPLKKEATLELENGGFRVDYLEIADAATLEPVEHWNGKTELVVLVAAFLGEVRLIDNMLLNVS